MTSRSSVSLGRPPQPPVNFLEERALLVKRRAIEGAVLAVEHEVDAGIARDHGFKREPPQFAEPVGKARRHIDRERHPGFLKDRIGVFERVAIAVVEGQAHEAALEIVLGQAPVHLVEADDIDARAAQQFHHPGEKARRDLKQPIGLEQIGPRRAHVMERQDHAAPADKRLERIMRAGEVQRFQSAADDRLLEACHGASLKRSFLETSHFLCARPYPTLS